MEGGHHGNESSVDLDGGTNVEEVLNGGQLYSHHQSNVRRRPISTILALLLPASLRVPAAHINLCAFVIIPRVRGCESNFPELCHGFAAVKARFSKYLNPLSMLSGSPELLSSLFTLLCFGSCYAGLCRGFLLALSVGIFVRMHRSTKRHPIASETGKGSKVWGGVPPVTVTVA